jgi:hypothetical protein
MKKFLLVIFFLGSTLSILADFDKESIKKDLPLLLGSNSAGNRFLLTFHPCWEEPGNTNEIKIYVVSDRTTNVKVSIKALGYIKTKVVPANEVIEFGMSPTTAQMYSKDDSQKPQPERVYANRGIEVTSDEPIICYGMTRYKYTSDGFLAMPVEHLGKEYIVSSWNDPGQDDGSQYLTSYTSIVAAYDTTKVKFTLGGRPSSYTPGENGLRHGDSKLNTMNSTDVWLIGVCGDYNDLSGSKVEADKPVAVISGNFCAYVPVGNSACDYLISQDRPIESWGNEYHVTPIYDRKNTSFIRVYASAPQIRIFMEDNVWAKISTVGGSEGSGFISRRVLLEGETPRPVHIYSPDSPISITQYNTGQTEDGSESDPFQATLNPISDYSNEIYFCTPGINGGVHFKRNYVNIIFQPDDEGNIPSDIEFGIYSEGKFDWKGLIDFTDDSGQYVYSPDGNHWKATTITLPDPSGAYILKSEKPIGALLYGFDSYDSYGYSLVGTTTYNSESEDTVSPEVSYQGQGCGDYSGRVDDVGDTESSKLKYVQLIKDQSNNYDFKMIGDFYPGISTSCEWELERKNKSENAKATLYFSDKAGNDTSHIFEYFAPKLNCSKYIKFDKLGIKENVKYDTLTLTNISSVPISLGSISLKEPKEGFRLNLDDTEYPIEIPEGDSFAIPIKFKRVLVKDLIANEYSDFNASVVVKAAYDSECDCYCFDKTVSTVSIEVKLPIKPPTLRAPTNGSSGMSQNNCDVSWNKVSGCEKYTVQVSKDSLFNTVDYEKTTAANAYTPKGLNYSQTYYWRVKGKDYESDESEWSEVWYFTVVDDVSVKENMLYVANIVYPNPAKNTITLNQEYNSTVKIYDINGKLLIIANTKSIDISELTSGKYLILISDKGKRIHSEFVKE